MNTKQIKANALTTYNLINGLLTAENRGLSRSEVISNLLRYLPSLHQARQDRSRRHAQGCPRDPYRGVVRLTPKRSRSI